MTSSLHKSIAIWFARCYLQMIERVRMIRDGVSLLLCFLAKREKNAA